MMQVSSLLIAPIVILSYSLLKYIGNYSILSNFGALFIYSIAAAVLVALLKAFKHVEQTNSPGPTSTSAFKLFLVNLFEAFVGALSTPLFLYLFFEDLLPKFNKTGIETTVIFAIMMGTAWTGMELLQGLKSLFLQIKDLSLGQWIKTKPTHSSDLRRFAVKDLITQVATNKRSFTEGIQASKLKQILRACRLKGGEFSLADIKLLTELNEAESPYLVKVLEVNGFLASVENKDGVEFYAYIKRLQHRDNLRISASGHAHQYFKTCYLANSSDQILPLHNSCFMQEIADRYPKHSHTINRTAFEIN